MELVNTFLEQYDFSGKKIILFATSGGSRWGDTVKYLKGSVAEDCIIETSTINGRQLITIQINGLKKWIVKHVFIMNMMRYNTNNFIITI